MKCFRLLSLLVATTVLNFFAFAADLSCSGSSPIAGSPVSGSCYQGYCSGSYDGSYVTVLGRCDQDVTFEIHEEYLSGGALNGTCQGAYFSAYASVLNASITGICSNGGVFRGTLSKNSEFFHGTCHLINTTGTFNGWSDGATATVTGYCSER